jgi:hypothetical protein
LKSSNAASFVMPAAANQRQAPSSRSLGAVHDGHERSEFGKMQAGTMLIEMVMRAPAIV